MKTRKQKYGQYFTSEEMSKNIIKRVNNFKNIEGDVLEPSFGDGSFINPLLNYDVNIDAFEVDKDIFKNIDGVNTELKDFILDTSNKKYDFIVGNPPYIELTYSFYDEEKRNEILDKYKKICSGRLNLTHIFLYKSFNMIKKDGIIAYLLPSSILTSPYYSNIRMMIYKYFEIKYVEKDVKFKDVAIKVSLLILQRKNSDTKPYFVNYDDNYFICDNYKDYPKDTITFKEYGYKANIGEVVWNQQKEKLTTDKNNNVLVYSTNIGIDKLELKDKISSDKDKKQYINESDIKYKNCIIIPRTVSKKIKYHLILDNDKYIFENHVIVITHESKEKLIELYNKFKNNKLDKYFQLFFNSSNLSITELNNIIVKEKEN